MNLSQWLINNGISGLGDVVKASTKAVGIKPCQPCEKRAEWLNEKVPFVSAASRGMCKRCGKMRRLKNSTLCKACQSGGVTSEGYDWGNKPRQYS